MSQNLKLRGLASYTGQATTKNGIAVVVKKGEVCRFSDEIAEKVSEGHRIDRENNEVPYFEPVDDSVAVHHNFTDDAAEKAPAIPTTMSDAAPAPSRNQPRQRATRTAAR